MGMSWKRRLWRFVAAILSACVYFDTVWCILESFGGRWGYSPRWSDQQCWSAWYTHQSSKYWACGGQILGSGRSWKEAIKSFTKSSFQSQVNEVAGIYGKQGGKVEMGDECLFLPNWKSPIRLFLGQWSQNVPLIKEISFEGLTLRNAKIIKCWHMFSSPIPFFNVIHLKKKLFPINLINSEESHNPSKPIRMKVKRIIRLPLCKMVLS